MTFKRVILLSSTPMLKVCIHTHYVLAISSCQQSIKSKLTNSTLAQQLMPRSHFSLTQAVDRSS